jgi:type I restriction enzyme M protein
MLGAIIGDIVGSRFEFDNHRDKQFELFAPDCFATDDSIMTLAIAKAIMEADAASKSRNDEYYCRLGELSVKWMREIGRHYPDCGYGGSFMRWMFAKIPAPYESFGNGAAMRVSPAGFAARSEEEALKLAGTVTAVTHNHPEGIKGAQATAIAIFLARQGVKRSEIRARVERDFYSLDFNIDEIRPTYVFNETCQQTVPQAIECFLESDSFEDAIRTAVSLGGDSDTLAAIAGGIAGAFYGVPERMKERALTYLDKRLLGIYREWEKFLEVNRDEKNQETALELHPRIEALQKEIGSLRGELSKLMLERDELLYQECPNIELEYTMKFGALEYAVYELECAVLRMKRKAELIQAKKNRQETIDLEKIEKQLDAEFGDYLRRLEEKIAQMNAALERRNSPVLSKTEVFEMKRLYRKIVRMLHPDLNPGIGKAKIELFDNAVKAFKRGDLTALQLIYEMLSEPGMSEKELPDNFALLTEEKKRLLKFIQDEKKRIDEIKSSFPYECKILLQNADWVSARIGELETKKKKLSETLEIYKAKVEAMLE